MSTKKTKGKTWKWIADPITFLMGGMFLISGLATLLYGREQMPSNISLALIIAGSASFSFGCIDLMRSIEFKEVKP